MKERIDFFNATKSFVNFAQFCLSKSRLQIRYCIKLHESKLQDFFYYLIATRFEFARSSSSGGTRSLEHDKSECTWKSTAYE